MTGSGAVPEFLRRADSSKGGYMAGLLVLAACALVNVAFWWPLQYPPRWIGSLIGIFAPTSCVQFPAGDWKNALCGWGLAAFALSGTFVVAGLLFVFRKALRRALHRASRRLPPTSKFLWAPVIATLVFTMAWASIPFHTFTRVGVVWDGLFPSLVGALTWALLRYRRPLFRRIPKLLKLRDRLPEWAKYAIAFGVVGLAAWAFTRWLVPDTLSLFGAGGTKAWWQMDPPQRDQILAVFSLLVTFGLWAPRVRVARQEEGAQGGAA